MLHPRFLTVWFALTAFVCCPLSVSADPELQEITTSVPQDVTKVHFPPDCSVTATRHPKTMYTLTPSTDTFGVVSISTYPPNLVTAERGDDGTLHLQWDTEVAGSATEGGVNIKLPADQLESVWAAADAQVQILDGFTHIQTLKVSSDAKLWATMDGFSNSAISLSVSSDGEAKVLAPNASFQKVSVSSDGKLSLQALTVAQLSASSDAEVELHGSVSGGIVDISSDAKVFVQGNVTQGAKVSSDGELTVYGTVDGFVRLSSDAKLRVGGAMGASVEASSDAKVYAPTCGGVTMRSDAKCIVDNTISGSVDITVDLQHRTMQGTDRCNMKWGFHFGTCGTWTLYVAIGLVAGAAVVSFRGCWRRRCRNEPQSMPESYWWSKKEHPATYGSKQPILQKR